MRFKIDELREPVTVEIKGHEAWLSLIYKSFKLSGSHDEPKVTGQFTVFPDNYGAYHVRGELSFTPQVNCGRCAQLIPWEIKRPIDVRYLVPYQEEGEELEKDLTPEDLDDYYIENKEINVELAINDILQTALPSRLIKPTPDGKACAICLEDIQQAIVFEAEIIPDKSPFAVLKDLKLPE